MYSQEVDHIYSTTLKQDSHVYTRLEPTSDKIHILVQASRHNPTPPQPS